MEAQELKTTMMPPNAEARIFRGKKAANNTA